MAKPETKLIPMDRAWLTALRLELPGVVWKKALADAWVQGLDGAEAHELFGGFLCRWTDDEIHHGHPLYTGAMKLGQISDESHPRFSEHVDLHTWETSAAAEAADERVKLGDPGDSSPGGHHPSVAAGDLRYAAGQLQGAAIMLRSNPEATDPANTASLLDEVADLLARMADSSTVSDGRVG